MSSTAAPSLTGFRSHARELIHLGVPLIGSQLAQVIIHITDTVMLGWYSVEALAGLVLAGTFVFVAIVTGGGFSLAVMPLVASAAGTEDDRQVRRVTRMGLWLSLVYGVLVLPLLLFAEPIFLVMRQDPVVAAEAGRYLWIAGWALLPGLVIMVLRSYFSALGRTTVVLVVTLVTAVLNAGINYALIFGNWGAPELGVAGAAWGAVLSTLAGAVIMAVHAIRATPEYELFRNFHLPDWDVMGQVLRLGVPMGLTHLAEVGLFSFSSVLMGLVGTLPLAAHGIALQVATTTFMIQFGLSQAATVRAGRAFGRKEEATLRQGAGVATVLVAIAALATVILFLSVPEPLIGVFLDPDDPDRAAIVAIGVTLLAMAALFQVVDGAQVMAIGLLRGVQDARVPMIMAAVSYWGIGAPACYLFGITLGWGAAGIWAGLVLGLGAAAVLLTWRFWMRSSRIGAPPA
jgi:MATE family multidrug resistance protein